MVLAQTEQDHEVQKPRGSKANIPPPGRRRRRTAGVRITEPCGPTKRRRSPLDMEGSRRSVWLWSCGERNAEEDVSRHLHRGNGKIQVLKGFELESRLTFVLKRIARCVASGGLKTGLVVPRHRARIAGAVRAARGAGRQRGHREVAFQRGAGGGFPGPLGMDEMVRLASHERVQQPPAEHLLDQWLSFRNDFLKGFLNRAGASKCARAQAKTECCRAPWCSFSLCLCRK